MEPTSPYLTYQVYKQDGWVSWPDWLGTDKKKYILEGLSMNEYFMSHEQARIFVHALGFKTKKEWYDYCNGELLGRVEKPSGIPCQPHRVIKIKAVLRLR